jgi:epoxyqueuosine reductase QueG
LAYSDTNELIERVNDRLAQYLTKRGYQAVITPPTAGMDPKGLMSQWSHKHIAHLAALGRFGVNCQLITPVGCTGRLGSLVTDAELGDSSLIEAEEHCLFKRGLKCLECLNHCPVQALTVEGLDRSRCYQRIKAVRKDPGLADLPEYTEVCGKCQVGLPCSLGVPS